MRIDTRVLQADGGQTSSVRRGVLPQRMHGSDMQTGIVVRVRGWFARYIKQSNKTRKSAIHGRGASDRKIFAFQRNAVLVTFMQPLPGNTDYASNKRA